VALQAASLVFPAIDVPESAIRYVWLAAILLFPIALIFSWFFEVGAGGITRTPPPDADDQPDLSLRRTDFLIIGALATVIVAVTWQLSGNIAEVSEQPREEIARDRNVDPSSVAVLPLANLSGDPEQAYFVSGMQDALISGLSRIRGLKVTSKTSTMRYADTTETLPSIAGQLGVAKLIEGSVYRVGDAVRISVQLIDALEDRQIWSDTFEDDVRDVLNLQREVATSIADEIQTVVMAPGTGAAAARQVKTEAYEAFLKGQFHVERFTPQDMMLADQFYRRSIELDPSYALAYYGLSRLCAFQAQAGVIRPGQARTECWRLVQQVMELAPDLPEAHMARAGHLTWQRFEWAEAERSFQKAIELNPSYAEARMFYSHYLGIVGRFEESEEQILKALELDPFNLFVHGLRAAQLMIVGRCPESIEKVEEIMAAAPGFGFGYILNWQCYYDLGDYEASLAAAVNHFRVAGGDVKGAELLEALGSGPVDATTFRRAGDLLAEHGKTTFVHPTNIAIFYEQGGDIEKAIDWFRVAFETWDPEAPYIPVRARSDETKRHPRFIALLRDMKHDYWADQYSAPE
jgi:TolB-like protein/tetratricopeptide (TPR) repeat protein